MMAWGQWLAILMACWCLVSDLFERRIPNLAVLVLALWVGLLLPFNPLSLVLAILTLLLGLVAYHRGWCGAGDSKLLAVCLYGAGEQWPELLLLMAFSGGLLSLVCLIHSRLRPSPNPTTVPYGVAILWATALTTPLFM
ncbi:peptidase [Aeromonas veronii]|nr:peptidase [Aeromonas veronii]